MHIRLKIVIDETTTFVIVNYIDSLYKHGCGYKYIPDHRSTKVITIVLVPAFQGS